MKHQYWPEMREQYGQSTRDEEFLFHEPYRTKLEGGTYGTFEGRSERCE